ncbi:DinB family protein [Gracilimonas amylolytica]|uniref:DinB family protein n=1 Tax=Gracilimonas amylolytica TaxID=1749045 RepID=UPI000CD8DF70|nr:DinB family protein [Gracilimonas amylolytica]
MDLKEQLNNNTEALLSKIGQIADEQFHAKPDDETWSPAQVLEHLYRSEFGIPKLFMGEAEPDPDRDSEAIIEKMRKQFLESDKKYKASGVILPGEEKKSKEELTSNFRSLREKIAVLADQFDSKEVCKAYEHPVYGYLTREEWLNFNIIHTQRHMAQIDRILQRL